MKLKMESVKNPPAEKLHAIPHKKGYQYYLSKNGNRSYIRKKNRQLAVNLAQIEYDCKVWPVIQKELALLSELLKFYSENAMEQIYTKMPVGKQLLIKPDQITDQEFKERWLAEEYKPKEIDESYGYISNRGQKMRSKSEVLIANLLDQLEIPYKYEKPLYLRGYGTIYPDFTLLDYRHQREIYFEHLGKLDNEDYMNRQIIKIRTYEQNGYYPGELLLLSGESRRYPLDMRRVEAMLRHYFCE